ncbi:MAG: hypothetical protein AB7E56_03765 [Acinetobacter sp.]
MACLIPAFTTGAAQNAPKTLQAKVASWCTATQALSFVLGPIVSTGLYQWHKSYPYYFAVLNAGFNDLFCNESIAAGKEKYH